METRAAELAGEMGPIANYASSKAVCGRAGLFPSRYQSDEVDRGGKLTRFRNARLRAAWMMVADNMCKCNVYWMTKAAKWRESWLAPIPLEVPRQKVREKPTSRRAGNTISLWMFLLVGRHDRLLSHVSRFDRPRTFPPCSCLLLPRASEPQSTCMVDLQSPEPRLCPCR